MTVVTSDNRYATAQLIVAPTLAQGANYTTVQSAITAASSGQTIFIRPGTYTENLTLKAGVNLAAFECDAFNPNVTIVGTCTFTGTGTVSIWGIRLQTNSSFLLAVTGSAASVVWLRSCYLNCTNNTGISHSSSNSASQIRVDNCFGDIGTTGISLFASTSSGTIGIVFTQITNTGASTTSSTVSTGTINIFECNVAIPFTTSSIGLLNIQNCIVNTSATNTTAITTAGTGATNNVISGYILSGSASAISVGTGTTLEITSATVGSSNTNAITGAGTLIHTGLAYASTSSLVNTTTITDRAFGRTGTFTPGLSFGGGTTGITYSAQQGFFTIIGNVVHINIRIVLTSKGSSTGTAQITGLPVTNGSNIISAIVVGSFGAVTLTATYTSIFLSLDSAATTATLNASTATGLASILVTDTMFANNSNLRITGSYLIA